MRITINIEIENYEDYAYKVLHRRQHIVERNESIEDACKRFAALMDSCHAEGLECFVKLLEAERDKEKKKLVPATALTDGV